MTIERTDRETNIIGRNVRALNFLDDDRTPRASIYLDQYGRLNVGDAVINVGGSNGGGSGPGAGVTHHHELQGLSDDDHAQYVHRGAARTISARHTFDPATAASPFVLGANAQGQTVVGLSADLLRNLSPSNNPGNAEHILKSTPAGALTLQQLNVDNVRLDGNTLSAQSGDLTLTAAGGDVVLPSAINIGADNFVSQLTGWRVDYDGSADFREIYADELHVKAFIADIEQALAGGQIISKSVALLSRDFVVPFQGAITGASIADDYFQVEGDQTGIIDNGQTFSVANSTANDGTYTVLSTVYFSGIDRTRINTNEAVPSDTADGEVRFRQLLYVEDLPGFEDTQVFASGDWVRLRVIDRSGGGLVVADVWGRVFSYQDESGGEQRWSYFAQDSGTVAGNTVYAGAIALDYGASGDGWHEITALDSDGPYSQIVTWETDPTNIANYTLRSRLGNLDGVTDADFPSIGGWGLYSTNAFLKGEVWAASGDVTIDGDGITIASGTLDRNRIIWDDGGTPEVSIGTLVDGRMILDALEAGAVLQAAGNIEINPFALVTIDGGLVVDDDLYAGPGTFNVVSSTSRVGIGTAAPDYRFDVQSSVADYVARFFNDGNDNSRRGVLIQAGADANPTNAYLRFNDGNGDIVGYIEGNGSGGVNYQTSSDERGKQDITPIDGALPKVLALEPITYRGRGASRDAMKRPGLVAQHVQSILPELVSEMDGMLSLNYMGVIPYLIGAVQALHTRIEALEAT